MHIAQFTNTYHPVTSGVVRSVSSFRQALAALGHNVFVFAQASRDYEDSEPFIFRYPALQLPLQEYPLTIPVSNFVDTLLPSLKLGDVNRAVATLSDAGLAPLAAGLTAQAASRPGTGTPLLLVADRELPYHWLRALMRSAADAGLNEVSFAVRRQEGA